ncbi:hypothetical protein A2U01_0085070, partial [Trifolium medium]|nr:hypothetical protein [Trifolium medium]
MHELYIEDIGKSNVDFTAEVEKDSETLGLENFENLGKIDVDCVAEKTVDGGASTMTTSDFVLEPNQESVPESVAVP